MNEFELINVFFKPFSCKEDGVLLGIGDDAACIKIPPNQHLLVSTDTLVAETHFLSEWDPFDIAYKSLMVNISDIAAMGGVPKWITLALTLPQLNQIWLKSFSEGLSTALNHYSMALVGGDTTKGPLSITITILGLVEQGMAITRQGAKAKDKIYVSGNLGAAALAVSLLDKEIKKEDRTMLMDKLLRPEPRVSFHSLLQSYATAAIDISDGLSADLFHICEQSNVGAMLEENKIPVHPLVKKYQKENATSFALKGGDDYELCFTIPAEKEQAFICDARKQGIECFCIGEIQSQSGLRIKKQGGIESLVPQGYQHF
ncbi:thiamine monophosphate kinase (AIR synthase) (plasmid) [Legionella adelaidensis]|uniref:Thiamine-monophosphate kinase n=1 Tax=Legionella adelaidensis TaxID=45056 RepID=A0A0W0R596_9GAMM|nr:thiamine-phosphate kinase [Legionella adelaidensis]KTC66185.1 thiamine monophosphate kinase (AIR synthase) [Legionella adelaidensis]VEH85572.1 thiamine monophosphate kinase (AIR synthase) [Legionella adelaidensis]